MTMKQIYQIFLASEGNSEGFLSDALHSVKVDYPISLIVQRSNISKKGSYLHDKMVKNAVHSIPEDLQIPVVL